MQFIRNNFFFKNIILYLFLLFITISCDKDFNEIGSDLLEDGSNFGLIHKDDNTIVAYNVKLGAVQTNNLPINPLGVYYNSTFGTVKASFVTQVEMATPNPTIDLSLDPQIESVVLTIPYFSTKTATATDGSGTYELDSIYGNVGSKMKLSIHESGYYIRDLDASTDFNESQKYYNNQVQNFENAKGILLNNDSDLSQNEQFVYSSKEYVETTTTDGKETTTRTAPGMRLKLDKTFFKNKIFNAPSGKLLNNNIFKDYFRGLYFKLDDSGSGAMALLDFKQGKITINYKQNSTTTPITREDKTIVLKLSGNTVSLQENSNIGTSYGNAISNPNILEGDEKLYLNGGEGSMTIIDLFSAKDEKSYDTNGTIKLEPNGISDELEELRYPTDGKKILINEASLTFYIEKDEMANNDEPNRIYLYDLNNKRPLVDYYNDNSVAVNPKLNKYVHGGIIEKETTNNKRGVKYKVRITNHIKNLVKHSDSTNVRLGLVVTESIGIVSSSKLKTPIVSKGTTIDRLPYSSVMNPLGTVLFGNNVSPSNANYEKRLKFEIYYTKPN